jgi:hypothetical protein
MPLPLDKMLLNFTFLPNIFFLLNTQPILPTRLALAFLQAPPQHHAVRKRNHAILRTVHNHYALLANRLGNVLELLGALVVPACCDGLHDEAGFLKVFWVLALGELVGGESVAICGKGFLDGFEVVGCV